MAQHQVIYGDIPLNFKLVHLRKPHNRVAIHVHPDGSVQVDVPEGASIDDVKTAVMKRARWVLKHVKQANNQRAHVCNRQYVSGESHFYMGRRYKLKIIKVSHMEPSVRLFRGLIELRARDKSPVSIKKQLGEWYRERAQIVFDKRITALVDQIVWIKNAPNWKLIAMTKQWGSCSPKGVISLNPHLVKAPRGCIEYVILHEMCHLKEHNHSPGYYRLLSKAMPDWKVIKAKLDGMSELILNT